MGRGIVTEFDVAGHDFLTGDGVATLEFQWNHVTIEGTGHGTTVIESSNYDDSGWVGSFDIKYSNMDFITLQSDSSSRHVLHGFGVFEGMTLQGIDTISRGDDVHVFEGVILVPPSATVPST